MRSDGLSVVTVLLQSRPNGGDDGREDSETDPRRGHARILVRVAVSVEVASTFQRDRKSDGAEILARTTRVRHGVLRRLRQIGRAHV